MRINNNMMAMNTHRQLGVANNAGAKSMEKLSSGFRINRAGDDAAGLAISEKMRGQIRGLNQASSNAQDGISLIQTAEGALNETHAILQRMRELGVQASTDTNTNADRANIQDEIDELSKEITRISTDTEFNTMKLLDGDFGGKKVHIGANQDQSIDFSIDAMGAEALGIDGEMHTGTVGDLIVKDRNGNDAKITIKEGTVNDKEIGIKADSRDSIEITLATNGDADDLKNITTNDELKASLEKLGFEVEFVSGKVGSDVAQEASEIEIKTKVDEKVGINVSTQENANKSITTINNALETVSKQRSKLGAVQNRLEHTIKNVDTSAENLQASESRIRDVDMAKEMMEQTKQGILQQASTAMLGQANQAPQSVLSLLR